ncbi:hypothetical protein BDB00DRAFT_976154, partial [Zychaea mexicana]|uniref:uncharacterized protein n=1 Tax=Zychaea mexicana TaxID=64656 RepID=UPI0022FE2D89
MGIVGTLRFLGTTNFKEGVWAGIQLDIVGTGKNDGSPVDPHARLERMLGEAISQAPDQAVMRLQQLQVRVEVLEAENKFLKLENAQNKTAEQILERSLSQAKEHLARETANVEDYRKRIEQLDQSVEELKKAGMESIELYESSVELHRVDMEAINARLMDEQRKVASLESEREELRKAGVEAIETYESTMEELKKEWSSKSDKQLHEKEELHTTITKLKQELEQLQVTTLNKDIAELESLIESKIFKEADLEEALEKERKQTSRLKSELADMKQTLKQQQQQQQQQNDTLSKSSSSSSSN